MTCSRIKKIFVDKQAFGRPESERILSRLNLPTETVEDGRVVYDHVRSAVDPISLGKEILYLTLNKGKFIKKCPGTLQYTCCGYTILHIGTYCTMDCSYCILQSYFHPPVLQYFVNHPDMLDELQNIFQDSRIRRIGTGEFTDSLIWERMGADPADVLVPRFAAQRHAVLELKTKTTAIDHLQKYDHNRKTIVSWSLNTDTVIAIEERNTQNLDSRLEAAKTCLSWGYPVGFHFDPIVLYEGCEKEYESVIRRLFSAIDPKAVVWISLGTFRFMPPLKPIIERRFPLSKIVYGEFIPGLDNKMRYFKPLRINMYKKFVSWIRTAAPDALIYFCMEDDEVWRKSLGFIPKERGGLSQLLDLAAAHHCGVQP
jgi:spore photoproduct lyase